MNSKPFRSGRDLAIEGYRKALRESLDELTVLHAEYKDDVEQRRLIDRVWGLVKGRLNASRQEGFKI